MDFPRWFTAWLKRHPLKEPADQPRASYTAEVMAKVREIDQPSQAISPVRRWLPWPRLALTVVTVAAGMMIAFLALRAAQEPATRLAEVDRPVTAVEIESELRLLEELQIPVFEPSLEDDLKTVDLLVLAEAPQDDASWIEETLQLLDELDEELPDDADDASYDDWLEELQMLDESELAFTS